MTDIGLGKQCVGCLLAVAADDGDTVRATSLDFGEYVLEEELGRGGMGVVWRAWDARLARHVALKMLIGGVFAQPYFLERFRREALSAGRLRHPGIAMVHDAGERDGQEFFTMELLEGGSLGDLISKGKLGFREAAALVEKTARAVAHAHAHGVLHRDLKPSNILLDLDGEPKVADFGLALLMAEEAADERMTVGRSALGTPAYMAPEAAAGGPSGVAADVFSLGAVLYEAVTGQALYEGNVPNQVLTRAAEAVVTSPRRLVPTLPPDLATVCMKCLRRDPADRYGSAADLADDLKRFLEGRAIRARPVAPTEYLWLWAKRNRAVATLAVGLLLSLLLGTAATIRQATVNSRQRVALGIEQTATQTLNQELGTQLYAADVRAAAQEIAVGDFRRGNQWLEDHAHDRKRGVEWHWLKARVDRDLKREIYSGWDYLNAVSWSADGGTLAVGTNQDSLKIGRLENGVLGETIPGSISQPHFSAADGRLYFCQDGNLRSCAVDGNGVPGAVTVGPAAESFRLAPGGRWAALGSERIAFYENGGGGEASVYEVASGRVVWKAPVTDARRMAVSADGKLLFTAGADGGGVLWDVAEGRPLSNWDLPQMSSLTFSPDGKWIAAGGQDEARLIRRELSEEISFLVEHPEGHQVTEVSFSPDGKYFATACTDRTVRIWNTGDAGMKLPRILRGHGSEVWALDWNPVTGKLVSAGRDGRVLQWDPAPEEGEEPFLPARFQRPVFTPGGRTVLCSGGEFPEFSSGEWTLEGDVVRKFPENCLTVATTPDGGAVLWNSPNYRVEWWPPGATGPSQTHVLGGLDLQYAPQVKPSPDGNELALIEGNGNLSLVSRKNPGAVRRTTVFKPEKDAASVIVRCGMWSPDGGYLAVSPDQPPYPLLLVKREDLTVTALEGHRSTITAATFSPDGRWLVSCDVDGRVLVRDLGNLAAAPLELAGHDRSAADIVFAPDGRTLLSLGTLEGVKFWHVATWRELAQLDIPDAADHFEISPDGAWLAVNCGKNGNPERTRIFPLKGSW